MVTTERVVRDGLAEFRAAGIIGDVDVPMRRVYVKGLARIPAEVVSESVERLLRQPRRYPLTLPEWIGVCADIVDERRRLAARQAKALTEDCADCHGTGWADVEGPNAVERCTCVKRALEVTRAAGEAIARPALPEGDA